MFQFIYLNDLKHILKFNSTLAYVMLSFGRNPRGQFSDENTNAYISSN